MFYQQSPAAIEQALVAELQRNDQQLTNAIHSLLNNQFMPQQQALAGILQLIDQHMQSLYGFIPQARWLSSQGFPQSEQKLNFMFRDVSGARMTYDQMYQNTCIQQAQMQNIWMNTQTAVTKTILDATTNQIRAMNESQQDFIDALNGTPVIHVRNW